MAARVYMVLIQKTAVGYAGLGLMDAHLLFEQIRVIANRPLLVALLNVKPR